MPPYPPNHHAYVHRPYHANYGGARPGAGRPRKHFTITDEHARYLREVAARRSIGEAAPVTSAEVLADLIFTAYAVEVLLPSPAPPQAARQ